MADILTVKIERHHARLLADLLTPEKLDRVNGKSQPVTLAAFRRLGQALRHALITRGPTA